MRIFFALSFVLTAVSAHASPLLHGRATAAGLISAAAADILYLDQNADKCTRYGARLRDQFLTPLAEELKGHAERLSALNVFRPYNQACEAPTPAEFQSAREAAVSVAEAIALRLQQAETPQGQFFGYSGDQVMDLALEAAPGFPECIPEEKGNPRSTRELKTYYAMKAKFRELQGVMEVVAKEAEAPSAPVCR